MDEKIRSIDEQIDNTLDQLRKITDDLMRMQGELDALKKEVADEKWPKAGDAYIFISDCGAIRKSSFDDDGVDNSRKSIGNVFRTREEAEERIALLRWLAEDTARWRKINAWREICEFAERDRAMECISKIGAERLKRDWFGVDAGR